MPDSGEGMIVERHGQATASSDGRSARGLTPVASARVPRHAGHQDAGAGGGGFQDDLRQHLRWAWRVAWRGKHLVLACLVLALAPTILLLKQVPPRFTATTSLVVEAPEARDALADRNAFRGFMLTDSVMQTEAALLSSPMLAHRVVEKLHLDTDPEFNGSLRPPRPFANALSTLLSPTSWLPREWLSGPQEEAKPSASMEKDMGRAQIVRAFLGGLNVQVQRRSYIITVSYTSESREKAALIANTLAEMYLLDRLEAGFEDARRVSGWLGERLESLRQDVAAAENAVEDYRAANGLRRKDDRQVTLTDQQLSELNSRLVLARADLAQKQARLDQARSVLRSRGNAEATSDVLQSPLIQRLREQEAGLTREMSDALKIYGDRHPRLVGLRAEVNEIRGRIGAEVDKISASLSNDVEVAAAGMRSLERQLESVRQQANVAGGAEVRMRELERQAEANRTLYESFLARFKREAEQEKMQRANARIVAVADLPVGKSYPREMQTIQIVAVLALMFGLGLVFLLDRLDSTVRSSDEAEELSGLPVLGMIPLHRGAQRKPIDELLRKPRSALADAVRSLRTAITLADAGTTRIVMVTSSVPKEGKSFASLCLAHMFSKMEGRVLLIDADIHRPRLHSAIGVDGNRGLVQLLRKEAALDELILPGVAGNLDFLPAGREGNIAELITGPAMEAILHELLTRYDRIIIDTPPVLAVSDTRIIASLVDQVIYLVRWNSTSRDAVRNGLKLLQGSGVTPSGIVLSQLNQRKHSRYGYNDYGQYYGRYNEYYSE